MKKLKARRTLAANLRIIRLRRNLSQEALADLVGLDRSYLGGIERAERNLGLDKLEKMAEALGVSIQDLLTEPRSSELADELLKALLRSVDSADKRIKEESGMYGWAAA